MITLKDKPHTENSVKHERPQNKNLKPFPRGVSGNPGGRPRMLYEESAAFLKETTDGKTNARIMIEALGIAAMRAPTLPHGVAAFKAFRELVEPSEADEAKAMADTAMTKWFMQMFMDNLKPADAIEI